MLNPPYYSTAFFSTAAQYDTVDRYAATFIFGALQLEISCLVTYFVSSMVSTGILGLLIFLGRSL